MKKKLLVFTLCFTLIFSSFNFKKSYADGGVISLPMIATVSALAVGSNIIINNIDDLYDLGRMFYDYVDKHNSLTWATVQSVFLSCVSLQSNKLVSVKSEFLDIVKEFFDSTFSSSTSDIKYLGILPVYPLKTSIPSNFIDAGPINTGIKAGSSSRDIYINVTTVDNRYSIGFGYVINGRYQSFYYRYCYDLSLAKICAYVSGNSISFWTFTPSDEGYSEWLSPYSSSNSVSFPYNGGYTWENVDSRKENENVSLPIPGNLGQLVGQGSSDFWDNTDNLVGNGDLSIPGVSNPSIGVDSSVTTFPGVDSSVPGDSIWTTIKEFIINLVVPSDTFWTDTWGGLYNNFTSSFPMVDMDGFNDLVTGEKKFPNIDINIMGVSGRVVNGDVVNSIVDWLRPIIAGFMMLCLMLFNYRKIYKLIRNTEPFGGIAPGTSDFKTGISEYSKHEVVKATDMVAEYQAWKERGGK